MHLRKVCIVNFLEESNGSVLFGLKLTSHYTVHSKSLSRSKLKNLYSGIWVVDYYI